MYIFPKLSGLHSVGTVLYDWVDPTRIEKFDLNKITNRELLVQIWYPSAIDKETITQYAPELIDAWKDGLTRTGFPSKQIHEIDTIRVHGIVNAPILKKQKPYPIIIFCHGYVAFRTAYTAYCEELASHGYIVVGIGHTYYAQLSIFPDKQVIQALPEHLQQTKLCNEKSSKNEQDLWIADAAFILDRLESENASIQSMLYNMLDLANIGAFGHSFGGSTAVQLGRVDPRCKAVVNLDGGLFGSNATVNCGKPLMIIVGQLSWDGFEKYEDKILAKLTGFPKPLISILKKRYIKYITQLLSSQIHNGYLITIDDANHAAFSDWVLLKHMSLYEKNKNIFDLEQLTGPIDGVKMTSIVNAYLVAFFDQYLKGKQSTLLANSSSPFREVRIKLW